MGRPKGQSSSFFVFSEQGSGDGGLHFLDSSNLAPFETQGNAAVAHQDGPIGVSGSACAEAGR